jgi:hypothetical protein
MTRMSLLLLACAVLSSAAVAQGDDAAYCAQLGDLARRYTGSAGGNGGLRPDFATLEAIDDCTKGNTAAGIPVLEKKLRSNGFTLPKR